MSKKTNKTKQVAQATAQTAAQTTAKTPEIDWAAIAALEKEAHKVAVEEKTPQQEEKAMSFEEWWLLRETDINKPNYYKEILKADFKARGLHKLEKTDKWDWAAKQFGLKW